MSEAGRMAVCAPRKAHGAPDIFPCKCRTCTTFSVLLGSSVCAATRPSTVGAHISPTRSTDKEPGARLLHRHRCPASRICRRCLRRVGPPRPEAAAPGDASRAAGSQTDVRACATRTCQPTAPVRPAIGRRGAHAGAMPSSTKLPCATDRPTDFRVKGGAAIDTPPHCCPYY